MSRIIQHRENIPQKLLEQKRWFCVNHDKSPKISGWNQKENQKRADDLKTPIGFDIMSHHPFCDNYLVFDMDHVLTETDEFVTQEAASVANELMRLGTFTERSQSGRGLHFVVIPTKGTFPAMNPAKLYLDDATGLAENQRAKLEIYYYSERYLIFTGDLWEGSGMTIAKGTKVDAVIRNMLALIDEQKGKHSETQEAARPDTGETSTDVERAEAMLKYVDPSELSHDEWLNVGMALKNTGVPFEIFDEWSQQDEERYNKKKTCEYTWNSFKRDGITIATLHKMAMERGYREGKSRKKPAVESDTSGLRSLDMGEYLQSRYAADLAEFRSGAELKTGFQNLDEAIQGVGAGLYVIGAIPSLGKTTLMHQMADNMAKAGEHVLYFSLEQEPFELASKSIARESYLLRPESALTEWGVQRGYDDPPRRSLAKRALERYQEAIGDRITIIPGIHNVSIEDIVSFVEDFIERTGRRPVVIIDYLQKIQAEGNLTDKQRIDYVTTSLKQLQSRNRIALFVISSFNRANYMQVADYESFKESGDIEYSADAVWALQLQVLNSPTLLAQESGREGVTKSQKRLLVDRAKEEDPRRIELKAIKHRGHKLYRLGFLFHGAHSFFEPDPHYGATSSNVSGAAVTDERPER